MLGQSDIQMPRSSGLTMFKFALPKGAGPLSTVYTVSSNHTGKNWQRRDFPWRPFDFSLEMAKDRPYPYRSAMYVTWNCPPIDIISLITSLSSGTFRLGPCCRRSV